MEQYNPEKIIKDVEVIECGELNDLSNTELLQFIDDASFQMGDAQVGIQLALRVLERRGIYSGGLDND